MSQVPDGAVTAGANGCQINCLATPRASRSALTTWHDGRLKVALAAPPVDGEANKTLIKFMSEVLQVPKSSVSISSGATGRRKTVSVSGITADAVIAILSAKVKD